MENLAWVGSVLLALCGLPLAIDAFRTKKADINPFFIWAWFFGELFTLIYVIYKQESALTLNYCANMLFILIIIYYKYRRVK